MHKSVAFKKNIRIHIKTAPTYFDLITIIREGIIWANITLPDDGY
jgi:hypothetical protein